MIYQTKDAYTWQVRIGDEEWEWEFDDIRPDGRGFLEVDQTKIRSIDLIPTGQGQVRSVFIPQGAMPVFFRRRSLIINPNDESMQQGETIHCIGWRRDQQETYLFVFDDGSTLLTDDLQAV